MVVEEEEEEETEPEKEVWNAYTTVKGLSISISGLKEGKRYKFRVAAKNIMGCSLFTETREAYEIKEQMSMFHYQYSLSVCVLLEQITKSHVSIRSGTQDRHGRDSERQSRS